MKKQNTIFCPLCSSKIRHKKFKSTHMWICKECPFVGFEFYEYKNLQDLYKKLFETKNINIVSIDNSNDVMNFLKTVKPDCILAGNYFPNSISGIELGLKLKETNIPFILFSGYQDIVKKARKE